MGDVRTIERVGAVNVLKHVSSVRLTNLPPEEPIGIAGSAEGIDLSQCAPRSR